MSPRCSPQLNAFCAGPALDGESPIRYFLSDRLSGCPGFSPFRPLVFPWFFVPWFFEGRFVECVEKAGVRDFEFCAQGDSPVLKDENGSRRKNAVRRTKGWRFGLY